MIYFIRPIGMDGPIKIGCSTDPVKRLKQLMIWSPFPLEIAAAVPGKTELEAGLQGLFASERLHGEWFKPSEALLTLIAQINRGDAIGVDGAAMERAKSAMRVASGIKSHLTKRVNNAEKAIRELGVAVIRPEHIRQSISEYTGPDKPAPTQEHHALISLYVRELAELATPTQSAA